MIGKHHNWLWASALNRPSFNMRSANRLVDKHILVAYTYLKQNRSVDYRKQRHGVITNVDHHNGITILEAGTGETFTLPPDLRSLSPAAQGVYRLRSTGEEVTDIDVISRWLVDTDASQPRVARKRSFLRNSGTYSVYGIGTNLYGHANKSPDGSYIATKWITLFLIPLLPIASFRIINRTPAAISFGFGLRGTHQSELSILNVRQIVHTYLVAIPMLFLLILAIIKV